METILYLTVPHTGTTSFLELFKADSKIHVVEMHDIWVNKQQPKSEKMMMLMPSRLNIIHSHIEPRLFDLIEELLPRSNLIATWRDPLLSIITERNLTGQFTARGNAVHLVNQFVELIHFIKRLEPFSKDKVAIFPVDLMAHWSPSDRAMKLLELPSVCNAETINKYAETWVRYKKSDDNPLKALYRLGQAYELAKFLPREFEALNVYEPVLRPFMENLGYKNLLWWTTERRSK